MANLNKNYLKTEPDDSSRNSHNDDFTKTKRSHEEAEKYLSKHRIIELFEDLCTTICFKQP